MVWRGPGIPQGACIRYARIVDVMPTLMEFLDRPVNDAEGDRMDGVSLADRLRSADPTGS
jgi:hypothetical protein